MSQSNSHSSHRVESPRITKQDEPFLEIFLRAIYNAVRPQMEIPDHPGGQAKEYKRYSQDFTKACRSMGMQYQRFKSWWGMANDLYGAKDGANFYFSTIISPLTPKAIVDDYCHRNRESLSVEEFIERFTPLSDRERKMVHEYLERHHGEMAHQPGAPRQPAWHDLTKTMNTLNANQPRMTEPEMSLDVSVKPGTHARLQLADDPFIKLFLPRFLVVARPNFGETIEPPERMDDKAREAQLWDEYKSGRRQAARMFAVPDDVIKIWVKMAVAQHKQPDVFKVNHLASAYVPLQLVAGYLEQHQEVQPQTMVGFLESIKPLNAEERAIVDRFMQRRENELGSVTESAKTPTTHQPVPPVPKAESFREKAKPVALSTRVEKSNASICVKISPRVPHNPQIAGVALTISAVGAEDAPPAMLTDKHVTFEQALRLVEEGLQRTENVTQFNQWLSGKFAEQHMVAEVRGR